MSVRLALQRTARLALASVLLLAAAPAREEPVPEPEGYRMDDFRQPTPATLRGATVIDTKDAAVAWRAGSAFIDVMPRPPRPANLPPATLWRDPPRDSLPGAIWLVNTGFGELNDEADAYFRRGLEAAASGDRDKPLVFLCLRDCWMSWNAAKRALAIGYRNVSWFPDGTDGWSEAGLPLVRVEPWRE